MREGGLKKPNLPLDNAKLASVAQLVRAPDC